ncbi:MAG: hypothetical protein AB1499_03605 [Nitrospirota bacterium]
MRNTKSLQNIYYSMPEPLMGLIMNLRALPLVKLRYSRETFKLLDKLMERDIWTYEKLESYVQEQLQNIIDLAKEIPFYRKYAETAQSIKAFPVLIRDMVKKDYPLIINGRGKNLIKFFTSGSSGSGLPTFYDRDAYVLNWAYGFKHFLWAGVHPRDWRISFFGSRIFPTEKKSPPFWMKNHFEHQYFMSIFHISDENAHHYVNFLSEHQGMILEGFPTVLYLIARYVKAIKGKLTFKVVLSTGEPLFPHFRQEIEEAFGSKAYDSYGMTEWSGLILECEKGGYHALLDCGYLEILRANGEAADIGEEGYLTWTGFTNKAMPFIRYRIGDKGKWEDHKCTCGRPYPLVKPTITRDSDYLITPDGRLLSPRAVNQVLKDKISFKACQFVQENKNEVIIRVVPDKTKDFRRDLENAKYALGKILGQDLLITEKIADEPVRRGTQGKIPLIISKIL